jgi:hypothetical protein
MNKFIVIVGDYVTEGIITASEVRAGRLAEFLRRDPSHRYVRLLPHVALLESALRRDDLSLELREFLGVGAQFLLFDVGPEYCGAGVHQMISPVHAFFHPPSAT